MEFSARIFNRQKQIEAYEKLSVDDDAVVGTLLRKGFAAPGGLRACGGGAADA